MLTPGLFIRQVGDLSMDKRRLNIPAEMPKPQAPRHLFEPDERPKPPPQQVQQQQKVHAPPPTQAMGRMDLNGGRNGAAPGPPPPAPMPVSGKLTKEAPVEKEKKKKHHFFGKSKDKS
jgi:syntaxin-binding protein 1